MPRVGDRVIIEGNKVGQQRREGDLVAQVGRMIRVRWADGTESLITPGPGSVTIVTGGNGAGAKGPAKATPAKKAAAPAKKPAAKKPAAKKPAATTKKPAAKKPAAKKPGKRR